LDDTLWCLRALGPEQDNAVRLLVCDLVEPAMQFVQPGETRPQDALRVARAYARGQATSNDLVAARDAAWDAAGDAAWIATRAAAGGEQERIFRAWLTADAAGE
jgi:hypothetical protein